MAAACPKGTLRGIPWSPWLGGLAGAGNPFRPQPPCDGVAPRLLALALALAALPLAGCMSPVVEPQRDPDETASSTEDARTRTARRVTSGTSAASSSRTGAAERVWDASPTPSPGPEGACPGHWHAGIAVYVDGLRVEFPAPPYNIKGEGGDLPVYMHMHRGFEGVVHYEPLDGDACLGLADTLLMLDVRLDEDRLQVAGSHGEVDPGSYGPPAHPLRLFVGIPDDAEADGWPTGVEWTWAEEPLADWLGTQPPNRLRVLVVAGDADEDDLAAWQDAVPVPP